MKRVTLFLLTAAFLVPIGAGAAERVTTDDCAEMGAYTGAPGQFLVPVQRHTLPHRPIPSDVRHLCASAPAKRPRGRASRQQTFS